MSSIGGGVIFIAIGLNALFVPLQSGARAGGNVGAPADIRYTKEEFADFLAESLVANQLLIAHKLTEGSVRDNSFRNYISTLFTIWASNRAMPEPLLSAGTVESLLRGLAEQPEILENRSLLDDPLFFSTTPKEEWLQKLPLLAGFPQHLTKLYARQLIGDYANDSKAFREAVFSLMREKEPINSKPNRNVKSGG